MGEQRKVAGVFSGHGFHWVGDGFPVTNVFHAGDDLARKLSPFLMMDYAAPHDFEPTDTPRGVGVHPHRGFETVTLAFDGAVEHRDSSGGGGVIHPGDVQWMTAAGGILHKEHHETEWAKRGGTFHMMQLWVNLPAAHKMDPPAYQALTADTMGWVELDGGSGTVKVIAGEFAGTRGPASTHTPVNLWELHLEAGGKVAMDFPAHENTAIFVLSGEVSANGTVAGEHQMVLFENEGEHIDVHAPDGAHLLLLNGEPIDEPIVSYGPFVMNTKTQIVDAVEDFNAGRFGHLV